MLAGQQCRFTNAVAGTADFTYPGPSIDMQSPASAGLRDGVSYLYYAQSLDMSQWEIGIGSYAASAGVIARTAIKANSLGTAAKINFSSRPQIFVTSAADGPVSGPRVIPHARFNYLPGKILSCVMSGEAIHDIDINKVFDKTWGGNSSFLGAANDAGIPNWVNQDLLVNPVTGNDSTGSGHPLAPFKTVKKAHQTGAGTIWLDSAVYTERLNLLATDNLVGGTIARPIKIKALRGRGSVIFAHHLDQQPTAMTFTAVAGGYTATPAGGNFIRQIVWMLTSPETGRRTYTALPIMPSAAHVTLFGGGWFQDPTTRLLTIANDGMDFTTNAVQSQFFICYYSGNGLPSSFNAFSGTTVYLEGIDFVASAAVGAFWQSGQPSNRPVLYVKNCGVYHTEQYGIHGEGADIYSQNVMMRGTGSDGFNYDIDSVSSVAVCTALEIDNDISDPGQKDNFGPSVRNNQSSSGHSGSTIIQINGNYRRAYGQNIAHIGVGTYFWCIGGVCETPLPLISGNPAVVSGIENIYLEGNFWLDTVSASGIASNYGLDVGPGAVGYIYNCNFSGTMGSILNNGTLTSYTPDAP